MVERKELIELVVRDHKLVSHLAVKVVMVLVVEEAEAEAVPLLLVLLH